MTATAIAELMEEDVLEIGDSERKYLDFLYAMDKLSTTEQKIKFLKDKSGYIHVTSSDGNVTPEIELEILELTYLSEKA